MTEAVRGITLRKAYGASTAVFLAALLVSLRFDSLAISAGLAAGFALSLGVLASWQFIVSRAFDPKAPRRGLAVALALVKLPLACAVVYLFVGREWVSGAGFAAGLALPLVAIVLLAIGERAQAGKEPAHAAPRA